MWLVKLVCASLHEFYFIFCSYMQSQRRCFDVYVVKLKPAGLERSSRGSGFHELEVIETGLIIPSVSDSGDGSFTLNVITNSTLSANMFYQAILTTTRDTMEAGSFLFCKCMYISYQYKSTAML